MFEKEGSRIRPVSAFCFRSWRILLPSKDRMQLTLSNLVNSDDPEYSTAWREFFFNDKVVPDFLRALSPQEIGTVVEADERWAGEGWTTTRCAKTLRSLTKVSLVSPNLQDYLHCFLYALVRVGELDVGTLQLSDGAAEARFRLAERWATAAGCSSMPQTTQGPTKKDDDEDMAEEETPSFA